MKKFPVCFILLFVFLAFTPQIALGDLILPSSEELEEQKKAEIKRIKILKKELQCLYEKKLKLPQKYSGPNLKVERVFYDGSDFSYKGNTGNEYVLEKTTKGIYNPIREGFIGRDCTEYIEFSNNLWFYNVTDVPVGSRLRYIPETEEMEVLPPANDSEKKFMSEQKERMRKSYEYTEQKNKKKREERNKNIFLITIYTVAILALITIFTKKIRRK
ncbi:MAG: hypothetical protein J6S61_02120 [Elusimicrobiaceae bacterium]|nr:hypothetical protein [Elusimicrobiaceae bacterium]